MATEVSYNGDGSDKTFDITFPFLRDSHVKVQVGGQLQTATTHYSISGTVVTFVTAPVSGTANIRLYRDTPFTPLHDYSAGSSLKADALNDNQLQVLYAVEEAKLVTVTSGGITTGSKNDLTVNNYVSLPGNPITLTGEFSVSMWVKIHRYYASGMQSIICLADDDDNHFSLGIISTRKLIGVFENGTSGMSRFKQTTGTTDIAVDTWAHIVCCVSSGLSTGNNSATLLDSSNPWIAGELVGGRLWDDTDSAYHADIDANTAGEVTGALVLDSDDSTSNDWDTNDKYIITKCYINKTNIPFDGPESTGAPSGTDVDN